MEQNIEITHFPVPTRCPLCGAGADFTRHETHVDRGVPYDLYECPSCRAQWWEPLKNPGAEWYESDVRYAGRNGDPILEANEQHRRTISFIAPLRGRVLDVGCGVGNFLAWAKKDGWECHGIDFDRDSIETGKRTFGLKNLEVADLHTYKARHPGDTFDLVTFFDVFEHIDDHVVFIETVRSLLKPGGYISLSTPYRGGSRWLVAHDFPPRHLTRWDLESMATFMDRHGFTVRYQKLLPAKFFFIVTKLRFKYGRAFTFGLVQKVKDATPRRTTAPRDGSPVRPVLKIRVVHALAKTKDILIFGIPAVFIWTGFLFTKKRYTDQIFIAQLREESGSNV